MLLKTFYIFVLSLCGFCITNLTSAANAQSFEIFPGVCDSVGGGQYQFFLEGTATFDNSSVVHVRIVDNDSLETVFFEGSKDFSSGVVQNLQSFSYDNQTGTFLIEIATLPMKGAVIVIWCEKNGLTTEKLLIESYEN